MKIAHCDYLSQNSMCLLFTTIIYLLLRFTSSEDSDIPLSINCWPSDNGSGGCDVNIEYELENTELELQVFLSAIIFISQSYDLGSPGCGDHNPCAPRCGRAQCGRMWWRLHHGQPAKCPSLAGDIRLDSAYFSLCYFLTIIIMSVFLQHPLIDSNNKSGSLEFSVGGSPDDFFPVTLAFNSSKSFSGIKVMESIMLRELWLMCCSGARLCRGGQWGPSETFNKHDVLCREIRSCLKLWYLGCISHIFLLPRITCLSRMDFGGARFTFMTGFGKWTSPGATADDVQQQHPVQLRCDGEDFLHFAPLGFKNMCDPRLLFIAMRERPREACEPGS